MFPQGETGGLSDLPLVLEFKDEWTAVAVRICPKEGVGYGKSEEERAIFSACSCMAAQYIAKPCDADTGGVAACELCSQCTDGSEGSWGRCRGAGPEDCSHCGGEVRVPRGRGSRPLSAESAAGAAEGVGGLARHWAPARPSAMLAGLGPGCVLPRLAALSVFSSLGSPEG